MRVFTARQLFQGRTRQRLQAAQLHKSPIRRTSLTHNRHLIRKLQGTKVLFMRGALLSPTSTKVAAFSMQQHKLTSCLVIEGSKASNGYISGIDPAEETETEDDEFNYQDAGPSRKTGRCLRHLEAFSYLV